MIQANALHLPYSDGIAQCCITSPPYYGLRDYNLPGTYWPAGSYRPMPGLAPLEFPAWTGCLGLEPTPELYTLHLVQVFRDVWRVLRADGVAWVNLGDSYTGGGGYSPGSPSNQNGSLQSGGQRRGQRNIKGRSIKSQTRYRLRDDLTQEQRDYVLPEHLKGYFESIETQPLKPKNLLGIPFRIAFALQADGWILRSDPPWIKANAMPESVTDRPTKAHEYLFLLSKSQRYYYDADAVSIAATNTRGTVRFSSRRASGVGVEPTGNEGRTIDEQDARASTRNYRTTDPLNQHLAHEIADARAYLAELEALQQKGLHHDDDTPLMLRVNPRPYKGAHFAVFPPDLVEPLLLASTSEVGECPVCGKAWGRVVEREKHPTRDMEAEREKARFETGRTDGKIPGPAGKIDTTATLAFTPQCAHYQDIDTTALGDPDKRPAILAQLNAAPKRPQLVIDPFGGSGTTRAVAIQHRRRCVTTELNPDYMALAAQRARVQVRLF